MNGKDDLDESLLAEFISTFYGYGNYRGKYWFVGMEEGGGNTLKDIQHRLTVWEQRGKHELEDVAEYHLALGYKKYFTRPTKVQPTWNKLIRIVLGTRQPDVSLDHVKTYQREALGRWQNETCLLELLPLPSPSTENWLYGTVTSVQGLHSRDAYRKYYAPRRAEHLRHRISEYRPSAVVFYSVNVWYLKWWQAIAQVNFEVREIEGKTFHFGANSYTRYLVVHHPASHGVTNRYFHHLGQLLGDNPQEVS